MMRTLLTLTLAAIAAQAAQAQTLEALVSRVQCGTQVGLTKVFSPDGATLFSKGLDCDVAAGVNEAHRQAIYAALQIQPSQAPALAEDIMQNFESLPKDRATAILGVVASSGAPNQERILNFLCDHLEMPAANDDERMVVRQAGLALAVAEPVNPRTVNRVTRFFASVDNRWLEYPVIEFFRFHGSYVGSLPNCQEVRQQIQKAPSFYAETLLSSIPASANWQQACYSEPVRPTP
jgi:hypothetical protein